MYNITISNFKKTLDNIITTNNIHNLKELQADEHIALKDAYFCACYDVANSIIGLPKFYSLIEKIKCYKSCDIEDIKQNFVLHLYKRFNAFFKSFYKEKASCENLKSYIFKMALNYLKNENRLSKVQQPIVSLNQSVSDKENEDTKSTLEDTLFSNLPGIEDASMSREHILCYLNELNPTQHLCLFTRLYGMKYTDIASMIFKGASVSELYTKIYTAILSDFLENNNQAFDSYTDDDFKLPSSYKGILNNLSRNAVAMEAKLREKTIELHGPSIFKL